MNRRGMKTKSPAALTAAISNPPEIPTGSDTIRPNTAEIAEETVIPGTNPEENATDEDADAAIPTPPGIPTGADTVRPDAAEVAGETVIPGTNPEEMTPIQALTFLSQIKKYVN